MTSFEISHCFRKENVGPKSIKRKSGWTLPWWWIFIGYGLCLIFVGISIVFIIARGIEFGDLKSQQWLGSILSGFFSSIFLTQPLKVNFQFIPNSFLFHFENRFSVWRYSSLASVKNLLIMMTKPKKFSMKVNWI